MNVYIKREYDYAIRIVVHLAEMNKNTVVPLSRISERLFITRPFANKIVHQLRRNDIIGSVQGKKGGIYLKADPELLSILDILRALNFDSTINECLKTADFCPFSGNCKVHEFYLEQEDLLLNNMAEKKIVELINNPKH